MNHNYNVSNTNCEMKKEIYIVSKREVEGEGNWGSKVKECKWETRTDSGVNSGVRLGTSALSQTCLEC